MAVLMAAVPPHERPRERLLARGIEALTERELLALILRNGTNGMSALDLAAALLANYGSLNALSVAHPEELAMRPGVGHTKAASLVAAFALGRRLNANLDSRPMLRTPKDVANIAMRELDGARRERVLVLICEPAIASKPQPSCRKALSTGRLYLYARSSMSYCFMMVERSRSHITTLLASPRRARPIDAPPAM